MYAYLPLASISPCTATSRGTSPPNLQAALCVSGICVACGEDDMRAQRTSMMHDVPRDFLHQILECDLGELRWKDILNQVRVAFSDFVTDAQYWHRYL